jgi:hypothetical protein
LVGATPAVSDGGLTGLLSLSLSLYTLQRPGALVLLLAAVGLGFFLFKIINE